jgi:acylphosphatase
MTKKRVEAVVSGRVQGVGYRFFATHSAEQHGICGVIRNNPQGQVETVAEGDEEALKQYLADLRKGPVKSDVTGLQVTWTDPTDEYHSFEAIG